MTQKLETKSTTADLAELKKLFGPAPVLSSEGTKSYYAVMARRRASISHHQSITALGRSLLLAVRQVHSRQASSRGPLTRCPSERKSGV